MMTLRSLSIWYLLAGFLVLQFFLVSATFPLSALWSDTPLFYIDNAAHWYRITFAHNISSAGLLTGYDPYFNAGTMAGIVANPAAKVPAMMAVMMGSWLNEIQVWKLYVFLGALVAGLCIPIAMVQLRMSMTAVISGGVFALLLWWVSMFRWYHTAGMSSFVLAAYLALPYVGWVARFLTGHGGWLSLIGLGLFGALGLYIHPLFALPIVLWSVIFLSLFRSEINFSRLLKLLVVVPVLSVAPSLPWLIPQFMEAPLTQYAGTAHHQSYVGWDMILKEPLAVWKGAVHGSKMYSLLILASGFALWLTPAGRLRRLAMCFSIMALLTVLYAGLGASVEIVARLTQPNRFAPVAYLFLTVPAGMGIAQFRESMRRSPRQWSRKVVLAGMLICTLLLIVNINELRRELSTDTSIGHYGAYPPEVRETGPYTKFLLNWLNTHTDRNARILFEVSRGRIIDEDHIAAYLAYTSDREFIGGHYPDSYFADFTDGDLFGRHITELDESAFQAYADLYNLGWVVAFTKDSKAFFDHLPGTVREDSFRELNVYRINRPRSFFMSGTGRVAERGHNRIVLEDLAGEEIILKYHFMQGLVSDPVSNIEPVYLMDDPNPFIRIKNPPARLVISYQ